MSVLLSHSLTDYGLCFVCSVIWALLSAINLRSFVRFRQISFALQILQFKKCTQYREIAINVYVTASNVAHEKKKSLEAYRHRWV